MKIFLRTIALLFFCMCFTPAVLSEGFGAGTSPKYFHCNVYLGSVCFGISRGDSLNMQIPVDFVTYEVSLSSGLATFIYYGFHPETVDAKEIVSHISCNTDFKLCDIYKLNSGDYRAQYQFDANSPVMDVYLKGITKKNASVAKEFMRNFKTCTSSDHVVKCSNNMIFNNFPLDQE
jgi:hypothetical protein